MGAGGGAWGCTGLFPMPPGPNVGKSSLLNALVRKKGLAADPP